MPKSLAAIAALSVALLLVGCQSPPQGDQGEQGCQVVPSGSASDSVRVSRGAVPGVRISDTLAPGRTERRVVKEGDGRLAEAGSLVTFAYSAFDAGTGDLIDAVGYDSPYAQATVDDATLVPGLRKALLCSTEGSRVVAVVPPAEAFGASGNEKYGIGAGEPVVLVVDLVAVASDRADGERQAVIDSLPRVDVGATGEPQVSIPPRNPPQGFSATVLRKGDGETVQDGATVTVKYRGVQWSTGRTFDSTWTSGTSVRMPTSSFLPGFGSALVGQSVGSQVLAIVPPELGFGQAGSSAFGIGATDTLVYVIDILAAVQPPQTQE